MNRNRLFLGYVLLAILAGCLSSVEQLPPKIAMTLEGSQASCPLMAKDLASMGINSNPVLQEFNAQKNKVGRAYILEAKSGRETELSAVENADTFPDVSPDGKWVLYSIEYQDVNKDEYWLLDNKGEFVSKVNIDNRWHSVLGWLNNQNLIVLRHVPDSEDYTTMVLNPFTNQKRELYPDYPNLMKDKMRSWGGFGLANAIYDPTTTMVIYPVTIYDFVLRDIEANKNVAQLHSYNPLSSIPQWSPDGQNVVLDISLQEASFSQADELFSVDRQGNIQQLTHLTTDNEKVDIKSYTWSPDGKMIAFWYSTAPDDGIYRLGVLDVASGQIKQYCVNVQIRNYGILSPPIWSSSNDGLLVNGFIGGENMEDYHAIFLDLIQFSYIDLGNNIMARGLVVP